jgi:murein DD-endopeptidase MepM/ murein hydrolase activator NlpD
VDRTFIRSGEGEWNAPRPNGKHHQGVDIVSAETSKDDKDYEIFATRSGTVAYASLNPADRGIDKGYGNVVIIDHGDWTYSFYAHLAMEAPFSRRPSVSLKVGDPVCTGQIIGHMVKHTYDWIDPSTGNARRVSDPTARYQVHFSLLKLPPGRTSKDTIESMTNGQPFADPTPLLEKFGYKRR